MKKYLVILLQFIVLTSFAHIGSPDIIYQGNAGPYKVFVTIQPPDVVPGIAKILIDVEGEDKISLSKVIVQPVYFQYGAEGAPAGDIAIPVPGSKNSYQGELWLMSFGSSSVKISMQGTLGAGSTIIPVPAVATATRDMELPVKIVLVIMGLFLFASIISIIGASVGEATLLPGQAPDKKRRSKTVVVMTISTLLLGTGMYFSGKWWDKVEGDYYKKMFRPMKISASVIGLNDSEHLKLIVTNDEWLDRKISDLVPDHGKIMHLFLVNKDQQHFTHLHPAQTDSSLFETALPPLPAGTYALFADVVHANGMAETMTDTVVIPENLKGNNLAADDFSGNVEIKKSIDSADNLHIVSNSQEVFKAKKPALIKFNVADQSGKAVLLQPYLGMAGHAVIMKEDAKVFVHLHPMGTIARASQLALAGKLDESVTICGNLDDSLAAVQANTGAIDKRTVSVINRSGLADLASGSITFPYSFPSAGTYIVWVQIKQAGKIRTSAFRYTVVN